MHNPGSVEPPAVFRPGLQLSVVTVSLPTLPTRVKDRLLKAYIDKAVKSESHTFLIGGVFIRPGVAPHARSLLWLENRMAQLRHTVGSRWFDIRVTSSEHLCVLPWCATGSMKCIALDATGP